MPPDHSTFPRHQAADAGGPLVHAALARAHVGLFPASLGRARTDWVLNLAVSQGTQARLDSGARTLALDWLTASLRVVTRPPAAPAADGSEADPDPNRPHSPPRRKDPRCEDSAWSQ